MAQELSIQMGEFQRIMTESFGELSRQLHNLEDRFNTFTGETAADFDKQRKTNDILHAGYAKQTEKTVAVEQSNRELQSQVKELLQRMSTLESIQLSQQRLEQQDCRRTDGAEAQSLDLSGELLDSSAISDTTRKRQRTSAQTGGNLQLSKETCAPATDPPAMTPSQRLETLRFTHVPSSFKTTQEKAQSIWSMMLPAWDATEKQEKVFLARLSALFSARGSSKHMRHTIDLHAAENYYHNDPPLPRGCLIGTLWSYLDSWRHDSSPNAPAPSASSCTSEECQRTLGELCWDVVFAPGVDTGFEKYADGRLVTRSDWERAAPLTRKIDGRKIRWILKKTKANADDDPMPPWVVDGHVF